MSKLSPVARIVAQALIEFGDGLTVSDRDMRASVLAFLHSASTDAPLRVEVMIVEGQVTFMITAKAAD